MSARWLAGLLALVLAAFLVTVAILVGGVLEAAWSQQQFAPGQPDTLRRFRQLPPQDRQRVIEDLRRWNELPQERRQQLEQRYERFQSLPPEKRERVLQNYERWQQMTPEQREQARERWRQMSPEERQQRRSLPPGERRP